MYNKNNKFICQECGEGFRLKYNYDLHLKKHKKKNISKLGLIFCSIIFLFLFLVSIKAQECSNDTCPANLTIPESIKSLCDRSCEDLNCANFVWVETYIKNNLSTNTTINQISFINLLKIANYGMQEELDICNNEKLNYKGLSIILGFSIILLLFYLVVIRLFLKKN